MRVRSGVACVPRGTARFALAARKDAVAGRNGATARRYDQQALNRRNRTNHTGCEKRRCLRASTLGQPMFKGETGGVFAGDGVTGADVGIGVDGRADVGQPHAGGASAFARAIADQFQADGQ